MLVLVFLMPWLHCSQSQGCTVLDSCRYSKCFDIFAKTNEDIDIQTFCFLSRGTRFPLHLIHCKICRVQSEYNSAKQQVRSSNLKLEQHFLGKTMRMKVSPICDQYHLEVFNPPHRFLAIPTVPHFCLAHSNPPDILSITLKPDAALVLFGASDSLPRVSSANNYTT